MIMSFRSWGGLHLLSGQPVLREHTVDSTDNCPSFISGRRNESMWPDWVLNPEPQAFKSRAHVQADFSLKRNSVNDVMTSLMSNHL